MMRRRFFLLRYNTNSSGWVLQLKSKRGPGLHVVVVANVVNIVPQVPCKRFAVCMCAGEKMSKK